MQSPPFLHYLVSPRSKYYPQHHVLKHPQLPFLPHCQQYKSFSFLLCSFLHSSITLSLLGPNILLNTMFSNTLSFLSSHTVSSTNHLAPCYAVSIPPLPCLSSVQIFSSTPCSQTPSASFPPTLSAVQIIQLLVMQSPPFPHYLVSPRSKYSPQHHVLKHPQLPFLQQCQQYKSFSSSLCNLLHSPVTSSLLGPNILLKTMFSNN